MTTNITLTCEELLEAVESYLVRRKIGVNGKVVSLHVRPQVFEDDLFEFEIQSVNQNEEKICQKQP